jgi:hypothetical protein
VIHVAAMKAAAAIATTIRLAVSASMVWASPWLAAV